MHGDFEQTPHSHLSGSGCRQCGLITTANKRRKGYTDFIEQSRQVHGDTNDYSKVEYNSTNKKVIISCKMHGDFEQTPGSHLQGSGCPTCGIINNGNKRRNTGSLKKPNKYMEIRMSIARFDTSIHKPSLLSLAKYMAILN